MRLYGTLASPFVARVRIQALAKSLPVELVPPPGGLGSDAMRELSLLGRIPVLEVAGHGLPESTVIQEYLEDAYPQPSLRGESALEAAQVRLVARVVDLYLVPALQPLRAALGNAEHCDLTHAQRGLEDALSAIESCLPGEPFAAGKTLTLADCALAPIMFYVRRLAGQLLPELPWQRWPKLQACESAMNRHPAVAAVIADIIAALPPAKAKA